MRVRYAPERPWIAHPSCVRPTTSLPGTGYANARPDSILRAILVAMMDTQDPRDRPDTGDTGATRSPDTLLTAEAAAAALGLSARQVRRYGTDGTLQAVREHGRVRYRADDVARLAAARGLAAPAIRRSGGPAKPTTGPDIADNADAPDTPATATGDKTLADRSDVRDTALMGTSDSAAMSDTAGDAEPDIGDIADGPNLATKTAGPSRTGHTPASAKAGGGPPRYTPDPQQDTPITADSTKGADTGVRAEEGEGAALLLAVEGLREELRAAREDSRKITDELGAARREAGLWEGRARTLDERLRQVEQRALSSGQDIPQHPEAGQDGHDSGQRTADSGHEGNVLRGLRMRVAALVRRFRHT